MPSRISRPLGEQIEHVRIVDVLERLDVSGLAGSPFSEAAGVGPIGCPHEALGVGLDQRLGQRQTEAAPCALSRSEHTSAPTPPSLSAAWPEALYRLTLYTRPELAFRLGDRVEVTDEGGSVWMGRTSDSFRYDSHCVTVVEISGVEPSAGDAEGVCGGQVSRETGKEGQA